MAEKATKVEAGLQRIEFRAMGSDMFAAVESDDPAVGFVLAQVPRWFARWEQTLSRFKGESELSCLNVISGVSAPVRVSDTLWEVLRLALQAANYTGGLVTPTVLDALEAAGYDTSFDTMNRDRGSGIRHQDRRQMALPPDPYAWREIKIYPGTHSVELPRGVRLDFGGIAKGWAADEAAARLAEYGPAIVNAGGDIAVSGPAFQGEGWPIGVDAPILPDSSPDAQLELLRITSGGVATSGRDFRRWRQGGQWRHHIIDPRTGSPAHTDVLAATVVAPTACMAEIGAKVALLLGSGEGLEWLEARTSLAGLLVLEDGREVRSRRLKNFVWSTGNGI